MPLTDEQLLSVLHDHYKDTFGHLLMHYRVRGRLTAFVAVVVCGLFLDLVFPAETRTAVEVISQQKLGELISIDTGFIRVVLWFVLLALFLRYSQLVVHIDRQYNYLHVLEDKMNQIAGSDLITREGKSYLKGYPFLQNWAHFVFRGLFPCALALVICARIVIAFLNGIDLVFIIEATIAAGTLITIGAYAHFVFCGKKE